MIPYHLVTPGLLWYHTDRPDPQNLFVVLKMDHDQIDILSINRHDSSTSFLPRVCEISYIQKYGRMLDHLGMSDQDDENDPS